MAKLIKVLESLSSIIIEYIPVNIAKDMPMAEDIKYTLKWFSDEQAVRAIFCKNDMNL